MGSRTPHHYFFPLSLSLCDYYIVQLNFSNFIQSKSKMEALVNLFSLAGRTAVITGGTRGIGATMAIALAEAGADIILVQVSRPERSAEKK